MSSPLRILFCDHRGAGLAQRAGRLQLAGATLEVAESVRASCERLERAPPDVLVLDPAVEGGERERAELARRAGPGLARLLCVAPEAQAQALAAARSEDSPVFDVVRRDAGDEEFLLRLERLARLVRERARVEELEHRASHDGRTDLLRPESFEQRLAEHVSAAARHHFEFALVLLDLDDFGRVNKAYDHTIGDLVIAKVGEVIRKNLRQEDVAGRLGGDEFGVLLPYTGKLETAHAVRRLRDEIKRLTPLFAVRAPGLEVSASIGFETCDGGELDSLETLRAHAELALRAAKQRGGGQAVYFRSLEA